MAIMLLSLLFFFFGNHLLTETLLFMSNLIHDFKEIRIFTSELTYIV